MELELSIQNSAQQSQLLCKDMPGAAYRAGRALALPIFEFLSSTRPFCLHNSMKITLFSLALPIIFSFLRACRMKYSKALGLHASQEIQAYSMMGTADCEYNHTPSTLMQHFITCSSFLYPAIQLLQRTC